MSPISQLTRSIAQHEHRRRECRSARRRERGERGTYHPYGLALRRNAPAILEHHWHVRKASSGLTAPSPVAQEEQSARLRYVPSPWPGAPSRYRNHPGAVLAHSAGKQQYRCYQSYRIGGGGSIGGDAVARRSTATASPSWSSTGTISGPAAASLPPVLLHKRRRLHMAVTVARRFSSIAWPLLE